MTSNRKKNCSLNSLSDEQDKLRDEFQEMKTSIKKFEEEAKREEAQNQTLMIKGFDTLVNGMRVLDSHQVHISQQIADTVNDNNLTSMPKPDVPVPIDDLQSACPTEKKTSDHEKANLLKM